MTRKVPGIGRTLMYGCRGPVCDLDDRETFAQLLEGAKALAKKYKIICYQARPGRAVEQHGIRRAHAVVRLPVQGGREEF